MKAMVKSAMKEGAFGLSSGLKYIPGAYATIDEVVALARVAGAHGGIYITHMREEGLGLLAGPGRYRPGADGGAAALSRRGARGR